MRRISIKLVAAALLISVTAFAQKSPAWLENSVIYQVYPSSYKDSDGNGIGDIQGVISKLDYIESLGVGAIWFNPLFVSGWIDGGYDVIDYYRIDPRFGSNNDLVELIQKAHARGIHVFLDLVAGHTSDQHPWFRQSAEDTNLQYSDYYIWTDRLPDAQAYKDLEEMLKSDDPMQNTRGKWMQSDARRNKYYYKNFYACQPALNYGYANPDPSHPWEQSVDAPGPRAVRQELKDILAFWYNKGVDGFRVDLAYSLVKNDRDFKETMSLWHEIRAWQDEHYPNHVLMAEWDAPLICLGSGFNVDMNLNSKRTRVARRMYYDGKSQANGGAYFSLNGGKPSTYDLYGNPWPEDMIDRSTTPAEMLKTYFEHFQNAHSTTKEKGYYASITGNHDHLRFNMGDRNSPEQLKVMMAWIMTMPLPILYYGDEIGMRSLVNLPNVEGANHNGKERSGARTPMQWDGSENAGFSTCAPENIYLPVCPEWTPATSYDAYLQWKADGSKKPTAKGMITVESQDADPESLLNWTRSLIALRKGAKPLWASSDFTPVFNEDHPYPMVYTRSDGEKTYLIALNPTGVKQSVMLPGFSGKNVSLKPVLSFGKASCKLSAKCAQLVMGPTSVFICPLPE